MELTEEERDHYRIITSFNQLELIGNVWWHRAGVFGSDHVEKPAVIWWFSVGLKLQDSQVLVFLFCFLHWNPSLNYDTPAFSLNVLYSVLMCSIWHIRVIFFFFFVSHMCSGQIVPHVKPALINLDIKCCCKMFIPKRTHLRKSHPSHLDTPTPENRCLF